MKRIEATMHTPEKTDALRVAGAEPVVADGLDRTAVMHAVMRAEPEVVIHQMAALTGVTSFRKFDDEFALTNRLRTEGTDHLLEAARAAGASDSYPLLSLCHPADAQVTIPLLYC